MKFQIIFQTSRKVTIEFLDFGIYFTEKKYRLLLNGKEILTSDRVVQTISGLTPDTEYELTAVADGEAEETVRFKTDYEFVTLNVRRFGARGDGYSCYSGGGVILSGARKSVYSQGSL